MTLKAKFVRTATNAKHVDGKEQIACHKVVAVKNGQFEFPVTVRCWMGKSANATTVYASLWVNGGDFHTGHGTASGYGYHKESAAIDAAITSAGIELRGQIFEPSAYEKAHCIAPNPKAKTHIDGVGDEAIKEALGAIARAAGYRKFTIVSA